MARRRMFSLDVVDMDRFLDMPASTQNLYFHLGMRADDDGFVGNPKTIAKIANCSTDDIGILIAKGFIYAFETGVCVIKDWHKNNYVRPDRYSETQYLEEKSQILKKNDQYVLLAENGIPDDNHLSTVGIPNDNQMDTQVSIGKVSIGKVNKTNSNIKPPVKTKAETKRITSAMVTALIEEHCFGTNLNKAIWNWIIYKREKNQMYKEQGLKSLLTTIRKKAEEFGEDAVVDAILFSEANNYQGIVFDRLAKTAVSAKADRLSWIDGVTI